jgi:hypothetical protein
MEAVIDVEGKSLSSFAQSGAGLPKAPMVVSNADCEELSSSGAKANIGLDEQIFY